jgi:hypothetical protein
MTTHNLLDLSRSQLRALHGRTAALRGRGAAGEVVTWVILAAGLALVAVAVVLVIGAKLRAKAAGIELE